MNTISIAVIWFSDCLIDFKSQVSQLCGTILALAAGIMGECGATKIPGRDGHSPALGSRECGQVTAQALRPDPPGFQS